MHVCINTLYVTQTTVLFWCSFLVLNFGLRVFIRLPDWNLDYLLFL